MIKYIGSKRLLVPEILSLVNGLREVSPVRTVLDMFSGSSRVAQALKAEGYEVTANDLNTYAFVLAHALIEADANLYTEARLAPMIEHLNALAGLDGYFTYEFCEQARYFQPKNGRRVDAIRLEIDQLAGDDAVLKSVLLTCLMLAADRVDSTLGLQMAYLKDWAPRANNDLELRMPPLLPGPGKALQRDAIELAGETEFDVVYLDPPYNQHSYLSNYHVWESLVLYDSPPSYGTARKREDCKSRKSPFNFKREAAGAMAALLSRVRAKFIVLSFNNEGFFTAEQIEEMLSSVGHVAKLSRDHPRYVGAVTGIYNLKGKKVGKVSHLRNREYLFVVSQEPIKVEALVPGA